MRLVRTFGVYNLSWKPPQLRSMDLIAPPEASTGLLVREPTCLSPSPATHAPNRCEQELIPAATPLPSAPNPPVLAAVMPCIDSAIISACHRAVQQAAKHSLRDPGEGVPRRPGCGDKRKRHDVHIRPTGPVSARCTRRRRQSMNGQSNVCQVGTPGMKSFPASIANMAGPEGQRGATCGLGRLQHAH